MNAVMLTLVSRALIAALFLVAGAHKILTWSVSVAYFARLGLRTNQMNHFFKNLAILGGLMLLVAFEKRR